MNNTRIVYAGISTVLLILSSCSAIKPYQRARLNDKDMQFGTDAYEKFDRSVYTYREGAAGGSMGKSSGGCGCN